MRRNLFISNPLVLFSFLWIFVLLLYSFDWSDLYPKLSNSLLLFLLFTIGIALIIGYFTWKNEVFVFYNIQNTKQYLPKLAKLTKINILLMTLDIAYSGYIPILAYLNGPANGSTYLEYGMPLVHIVVVNGFSLLFSSCFWMYKNTQKKKTKQSFLKLCAICAIQPIICYSRAQLMLMLLGALYITLITNRNIKKTLIKIGASSIIILYLFGLAGDFRQSGGGENYFVKMAGANNNFYKTNIPTAFFWGYIYISSPLANVQSMIDTRGNVIPQKEGLGNLLYNNLTPGVIRRRLNMDDSFKSLTTDTSHLIIEQLNVGGIYYGSYGSFKWYGMIIIFVFYLLIVFFTIELIPRKSSLRVPAIVVLILITFMSIFSNPFSGDGFIPQLILVIIAANSRMFRKKRFPRLAYIFFLLNTCVNKRDGRSFISNL